MLNWADELLYLWRRNMFLCCSCQFLKNAPWCLEADIVCAYLCVLMGLCRSVPIPEAHSAEQCKGTRDGQ